MTVKSVSACYGMATLCQVTPVVRSRQISFAQMNEAAFRALNERGMIYITGEMFSRTRVDRLFCFEHNTGIGKTQWVTNSLIPYLRERQQRVAFVNVETFFPIGRIINGKCSLEEIEACFETLLSQILSAARDNMYIVLDECDLLFPSGEKLAENSASGTFFFNTHFLPCQRRAWEIIREMISQGKRVVLVSWLHPQDASLAASYLTSDENFSIALAAPVFEIEAPPLDDQFKYL